MKWFLTKKAVCCTGDYCCKSREMKGKTGLYLERRGSSLEKTPHGKKGCAEV